MQRLVFILAVVSSTFISTAHAGALDQPVVGGTAVEPGAFPDVVAVMGADGSLCSGTLIAADLVVTAGHCVAGDPIEVIVGSVDLAKPDGDRRRVQWARAYPDWETTYDVGVIMLEHPVFAKSRAIVQSCTSRSRFKPGLPLQLVGFGLATAEATDHNTRLNQVTVPLVDPTCTSEPACASAIAPNGEFVAGGHGVDACFGDSGGPMFVDTGHGLALLGIVSRGIVAWGLPCADGGVYVRADKVVAWIERVSGRKVARVACDSPADAGGEAEPGGGCNAAGAAGVVGIAGALPSTFALIYGGLVIAALRRARRRRQTARR